MSHIIHGFGPRGEINITTVVGELEADLKETKLNATLIAPERLDASLTEVRLDAVLSEEQFAKATKSIKSVDVVNVKNKVAAIIG